MSPVLVNYLKATRPLIDPVTGLNHTILPNADAQLIESARGRIDPVLARLEASRGLDRGDVAAVWTFRVATDAIARFDPNHGVIPTPSYLVYAPDGATLALPIDPEHDSPAQVEFYTWLNTLDGFPRNATISLFANRDLDPLHFAEGLTVLDITDPSAPKPVAVDWAWNAERMELVGNPASGLWEGAASYLVIATSTLTAKGPDGAVYPL